MPVPYTRETVNAIRDAVAANTSAHEILKRLGWDHSMLARVCHKHGIDVALSAAIPASVPVNAPSPIEIAEVIAELDPWQADLFRFLRPHTGGEFMTSVEIGKRLNHTGPGIRYHIRRLRTRLANLNSQYQVEVKRTMNGGFRLVIDESRL